MAKSYSLTVTTVLCSSILALHGCSGSGLDDAVLPNENAPESSHEANLVPGVTSQLTPTTISTVTATDSPEIPLGAAHPTVFAALSGSNEAPKEPEPSTATVTDTTDVADTTSASVVVPVIAETTEETVDYTLVPMAPPIEAPKEPDPSIATVTDTTDVADTASASVVVPVIAETTEETVDYTLVPLAPIEGELMPYGSDIDFVWSIPAVLLGTATGFNLTIADVSEGVVAYRNNLITVSICTDQGLCTLQLNSTDIQLAAGDNIWSVNPIGENIDFNIAEATFTLDNAPVTNNSDNSDTSTVEPVVDTQSYSEDFQAIKADADAALPEFVREYVTNSRPLMDIFTGYHSAAGMRGIAQIYRITNEATYMDAGVKFANKWIDSGRQLDGDGYLDWKAYGGSYDGEFNFDHSEWRAACGIADIVIEMQRSGYESIPGSKDEFVAFLKREVWEKWTYGHDIYSRGWKQGARGTKTAGSSGRWAVIAMALDKTHATPGNNEYYKYLSTVDTSLDGAWGISLKTIIERESYDRGIREKNDGQREFADTSHAGDWAYSVMRAKQLGYDPGGLMDQALGVYERLLNDRMFKTSAGFSEITDGSGGVNTSNNASAHGHALSAALSTNLKNRWVEFYRYNDPQFNGQATRKLWMAGGILYALSGGTL